MKTQLIEKLVEQLLSDKTESWNGSDCPFIVGKAYFIRTVTYHMLGKIERISGEFLVLSDASWIADSGRFNQAIAKGELSEIEYVGDAILGIQTIVDAFPWGHKVPKESK